MNNMKNYCIFKTEYLNTNYKLYKAFPIYRFKKVKSVIKYFQLKKIGFVD